MAGRPDVTLYAAAIAWPNWPGHFHVIGPYGHLTRLLGYSAIRETDDCPATKDVMMPTEICPITPSDFEAWLPLWHGYQTFYKTDIPDDVSKQTWQRFLDDEEPMHATLAWQDGKAIGMVHWIYHRSCWTTADYCYLQDLYVAEDVRGTGMGRKLIEHVYDHAENTGAARVYWLTQQDNVTAMKLYDRIADKPGFIQYRKML